MLYFVPQKDLELGVNYIQILLSLLDLPNKGIQLFGIVILKTLIHIIAFSNFNSNSKNQIQSIFFIKKILIIIYITIIKVYKNAI